jgi:hypothetical protein
MSVRPYPRTVSQDYPMTGFASTSRFDVAQKLSVAMSVALVVFTWLPTLLPAAI